MGGLRTQGYVSVPSAAFDPLGLASCSFLYRGVSAKHPAIEDAKRGVVRPADPTADLTPEQHAEGGLAGQWEDEESGLSYNLHRYYDPETGQYLCSDPIGLDGGLRTQGYVHDPLQWVDPSGLALCQWDSKARRWRDSSGKFKSRPADLPAGKQIDTTVYRFEQPDRISTTWTAHEWNVRSNHRYTGKGLGGVYGADSPATALAEVNHYGVDLSTRDLISKEVSLNNVLDLTDGSVRNRLGVSLEDITGDGYSVTQKIGNMAAANGYDGIMAPSARNPAGYNLI